MLSFPQRLLLASSFLFIVCGNRADASESKPTPAQIAQWIEKLGDNDFKVRENASKKLWQAGAAAESALEKAITRGDPEVVRRVRELLDKFHWGIYPDTPAEIVALIRAYQSSADKPRTEVLEKLLDSGEPGLRAVLKIAAAEKDANQRRLLGDLVAHRLPSTWLVSVTEGKYEQFERLLELGHENKFIDHSHYAAYWLLRGQLPERIAHFRARLSKYPEDKQLLQALTYLHRANGDLVAARQAAEKSGRADLLEGILYEQGDWKALAERPDGLAKPADKRNGAISENLAEKWAYRAAFAHLAGKEKGFENALRELHKCPEGKQERDSLAYVAAKGLLLNDRPADGLELLRTIPEQRHFDQRQLRFDILCARLDFGAAIEASAREIPADKEILRIDLARARVLCLLGENEGKTLFDRYAERIKDGVDPFWVQSLLAEEMRAGSKDQAFSHAANALGVASPKTCAVSVRDQLYLTSLFPQQATLAQTGWAALRGRSKNESPAEVLKRLRQRMEDKNAAKEVKRWIEEGDQSRIDSLAEAALLAGLDDLAASLLEKANSRDALLRLGDLLAEKKQWEKAAQRYRQAWTKQLQPETPPDESDRSKGDGKARATDPLPLYLAGDALIRAGQEKEGIKLIEQAHALPFTDAGVRYNFIDALTKRGHKEAARREAELMLRVSEPNSFYANDAFRRLAFVALARKDYLQAAEGFEKSMLRCLQASTSFMESAAYIYVPARIHMCRAVGLLTAGKLNEALRQADLALVDSPGFTKLPIALVPELERRGHQKEAAALFNRCYGLYERLCRDYPRCSWAHNDAAWMAACCRRDLDAALQHAEKAIALMPARAGYYDTLAEVYFQRGDKEKAIASQKRAIELDPKRTYFRQQLKRLQAGDPSADRPLEDED